MLFDPKKFYRRKPDLVGRDGQLFTCHQSLDNAKEREGFPPGRLIGRIRVWNGEELNAWLECRPTERLTLPEGFGGKQPNSGRKKKELETIAAAAR